MSQLLLACIVAMKVLEPIHLQTAGFVQACQHSLDLFTCRSQMFLSVQSPTEAGGCTFPKHSLASLEVSLIPALIVANTITAERLAFTAGFQAVLEDEGKSLGPSLGSSDTLLWCLRTYLLTIQIKTKWPPMMNL